MDWHYVISNNYFHIDRFFYFSLQGKKKLGGKQVTPLPWLSFAQVALWQVQNTSQTLSFHALHRYPYCAKMNSLNFGRSISTLFSCDSPALLWNSWHIVIVMVPVSLFVDLPSTPCIIEIDQQYSFLYSKKKPILANLQPPSIFSSS